MIPKKDLLYSTWNSTELCTSLGGKGVWGRMGTCTCVAESLKASPETVTTVLITYTSIQNKKFKVWKKKKKISLSAHRREAWGAQHSEMF